MATLSSNAELASHIKNDPKHSDFIRDQLTTIHFPLAISGSDRIPTIPGKELMVQSPGTAFELKLDPPNTALHSTEFPSIIELRPPGGSIILPLNGYEEALTCMATQESMVFNTGILQASSYPPPEYYGGGGMDPPDRPSDSGKGKQREESWGDDERQEYRESSAGGSAGGNNEEGGSSKRKTSKKTPMACHFCRRRKLKCDGAQPTCHTCAEKSLECKYDEQIRRRGPGRKNRLAQQQPASSTSEVHSDTSQRPSQPSSSRMPDSLNTPLASLLPRPPMPRYPYELGLPPSGLESRIVSSRLASETRPESTERYVEDYVYTQQPRSSSSAYYPQQPSTSYSGYQQSSYRDQPPLPPPAPLSQSQQSYPSQQYYRQDYPSTSSYATTTEYSARRQSYAEEEEEEEYVSDDDNTTSSRRGRSSGYEEDPRRRGGDTWQR